ncbi:hypothetical protein BH18ACT7_BH18ACT7_25980 [soil metagenome]
MDVDQRACRDALDKALSDSGLSQNAFAVALGTSASRLSTYRSGKVSPSATLFLRALRIAQALRGARRSGWMTAPRTAETVAAAVARGQEMHAFKLVLQGRDHLRALLTSRPNLAAAWAAAPRSTGDRRWDALLAALAAHEFEALGLATPAWTDRPALPQPWILDSPRLTEDEIRERTPAWLAARNIYVNPRDLVTL